MINEITHFHGILPPEGLFSSSHPSKEDVPRRAAPVPTGPDSLILNALRPLQDKLDVALKRGDREKVLRSDSLRQIAYGALSQVADALAAYGTSSLEDRGDPIQPGQVRIHALLVELEDLPLESHPDGTLAENGTAVHVSYCNWAVDRGQAAAIAHALVTHLQSDSFQQTLRSGAWVVIS
jgi:hypothetical protein